MKNLVVDYPMKMVISAVQHVRNLLKLKNSGVTVVILYCGIGFNLIRVEGKELLWRLDIRMDKERCVKDLLDIIQDSEYYESDRGTTESWNKTIERNKNVLSYIRENLDSDSCSNCSVGLVITCEDCGKSLCRYCRCYDGNEELCTPCINKRLEIRRENLK